MKNIIYLSVSLVIYLAGIILLLVKLKHIIDNPERYDEPSLVAEADAVEAHKTHLNIFKSLSHQYSFVGFILTLVITALDFGIVMLAQKLLIGANEQIFLGTTLIGVIALFFLNIIVGMAVIPLMIKSRFLRYPPAILSTQTAAGALIKKHISPHSPCLFSPCPLPYFRQTTTVITMPTA